MPASTELYDLIKSMTKSEKRYFKLSVSVQGGEKNYFALFDAIEEQAINNRPYDENAIKKQFSGEAFTKQFHVAKNYLQKLIMKSLRNFYTEKTIDDQIRQLMHQAEILEIKGHYKSSLKELDKAEKLAKIHEKFPYLLLISNAKRQWLSKNFDIKVLKSFSENTEQEIIRKVSNISAYQKIRDELFLLAYKSGQITKKADKDKIINLDKNILLSNPDHALSFEAKFLYFTSKRLIANLLDHSKDRLKYSIATMEHCKKNIHILKYSPTRYLAVLINHIQACIDNKLVNNAQNEIKHLSKISPQLLKESQNMVVQKYLLHIDVLEYRITLLQKNIPAMELLCERLEKRVLEYETTHREDPLILIHSYVVACIQFITGNYDISIHWLNKIINQKEMNIGEDMYCFSRILFLIVHYEIKNYTSLPFMIKSTQRYLAKRKRINKTEAVMLQLFKELLKAITKQDEKVIFKNYQPVFKTLSNEGSEKIAFELFDYITWVDSKIQGKTMKEIYEKK